MILLNDNFANGAQSPTQVIVNGGAGSLTREQMTNIRQLYFEFRTAIRLSPAEFFTSEIKLSDGTVVRMESINGQDRVMVWPVGGESEWVRVYWLRTFDESPGDETGDFDLGNPSNHLVTVNDLTKRLACFAGVDTAVFQRNVSLDGMMEIFVEKNRQLFRAGAAPVIADADDTTPDADGVHEHEVDVWLAGDRLASIMDKRIPMPCEVSNGSIIAFGNPYHGAIEGSVLHAAGGDIYINDTDVTLPNTHLVKFEGVPEVPAGTTLDWRNYAILHDMERIYFPVMDRRLGLGHWSHLYRTDDGRSYRVSMAWNASTHVMTATARECTVFVSDVSPESPETLTLYSATLTFPTPGGLPYVSVYPRFNISPNGKKVAAFMEAITTTSNLTTICDNRVKGEGLAVYEFVFSGGTDDAALSCAAEYIIGYNPYSTTTLTDVGNREYWTTGSHPGASSSTVPWDHKYTLNSTYMGIVDEVDNGSGTLEYKYLKEYTELAGERATYESAAAPGDIYPHNTDLYFVKQTINKKKLVAAWYGESNSLQVVESVLLSETTPSEEWMSQQEINGTYTYSYYKYVWGSELQYQSFAEISMAPATYDDFSEQVTTTNCTHSITVNGSPVAVSSTELITTHRTEVSGPLYLHYHDEPRLRATKTTTETTNVESSRVHFVGTDDSLDGFNDFVESEYVARHDAVMAASNNVVIYRTTDNLLPEFESSAGYELDWEYIGMITPRGIHPDVITITNAMENGATNPTVSWNPGTNEILTGDKRSWA